MSLQIIQTLQAQFETLGVKIHAPFEKGGSSHSERGIFIFSNPPAAQKTRVGPLFQRGRELLQLDASNQPTLWVAYSGGLDSHVLLHALHQLQKNYNFKLHAVHIHHGIHQKADEWATHSLEVGKSLAQHCEIIKVNAQRQTKQSLEETARNARYQAFQSLLNNDDYLITAHHADDQAETFLLQLLRGAGTKGLSAMPILSRLGKGFLWRPLLSLTRENLLEYANAHELQWIEDDSNAELNFDRNYLRHQVIPSLKNRWPHFANNAAQSAKHCAEAEDLVTILKHQDYLKAIDNLAPKLAIDQPPSTDVPRASRGTSDIEVSLLPKLKIKELTKLTLTRRHNVLRYWLKKHNLPLPSRTHLNQFETDFLTAKEDANPVLRWSTIQLRRYQNYIYVLPWDHKESIDMILKWNLSGALELPHHIGKLITKKTLGKGIQQDHLKNSFLEVRFRQGGESIHLPQYAHSKTLKNLFHELNIPPWERGRVPLIYVDGELAQVVWGSHCLTAKQFIAQENEMGLEIQKKFPCSFVM